MVETGTGAPLGDFNAKQAVFNANVAGRTPLGLILPFGRTEGFFYLTSAEKSVRLGS